MNTRMRLEFIVKLGRQPTSNLLRHDKFSNKFLPSFRLGHSLFSL